MSETKHHTIADHGAAVDESRKAALATAASSTQPPTPSDTGPTLPPTASDTGLIPPPTTSDINPAAEVLVQDDNNQQDQSQARPVSTEAESERGGDQGVKLCRHIKEDSVFCHCPAVSGRPYCYCHLRLRGQQMRMARALAQRQSYYLVLPPLEDLHAVQAALTHVTAALTAGLLEQRRAGLLLYALQQASSNLRFLARTQTQAEAQPQADSHSQSQSNVAPEAGQPAAASEAGESPRVVEAYPEFEAEFGLPPGLDLAIPPQVAFPPSEKATAWATAQATPQARPLTRWTKEDIELEELEQRRSCLSEESYSKQSRKVHDKLQKKVAVELRQEREAEWETEAARRNAEEEEKERRWNSMDPAQQRAYQEGVLVGYNAAQEQWRQEKARAKKPAAKVGREEAIAGMDKLPETAEAK